VTLTVAICTRGRPESLRRCLDSLIPERGRLHEVLVATDGVEPETDDVIDAARAALPIVHLRGPRRGLAANRNTCVVHATGEHLLFLDDDARLLPGFLDAALAAAGPDAVVTGWEDKRGVRVTAHDPDFLGFLQAEPGPEPRGIVVNATVFPTAFLRRYGFEEFYRYGSEEADIALLARRAGLAIRTVDAGNAHDLDPAERGGNETKRLRSRAFFSGRRYTRYEPHPARLVAALAWLPLNAAGGAAKHGERPGPLRAGAATAVAFVLGAVTRRTATLAEAVPAGPRVTARPTVSVVVPSYRRPDALRACLEGLAGQHIPPDEVVVVHRADDTATAEVVATTGVRACPVTEPGQVAALRAGTRVATGEVVAFTDDDAVPRRDWLTWLVAPYADPSVGAVGGRDVVRHDYGIDDGAHETVGVVARTGKVVGHHHTGVGVARDADHLKGANSSYRRALVAFPEGLRGGGAQVGNDFATSLAVRRSGARVVYEPRALVDHYPAPRHDADRRVGGGERRDPAVVADAAYNLAYVLSSLWPARGVARAAYATLVGDRSSVGVVRAVVGRARREDDVRGLLGPSVRATLAGARDGRRRPVRMVAP
jgi:glycosyltransferase involved in cell wall biosynthesis